MSLRISTAVTYHAPCARSLLSALQSLQSRHKPSLPKPILLFALAPSSTIPPDILSHITSTLTELYPEHVGCISAPLPYQYFEPGMRSNPYSCSLAYAFVNGVSFRSTISGRAEVQVGRWHAARKRSAEDSQIRILSAISESGGKVDWEHIWNRSSATSGREYGLDSDMLPDGLRIVEYAFTF